MPKVLSKVIWEVDVVEANDGDDETYLPQRFYFWFYRSAKKFADKVNKSGKYVASGPGGEQLWFQCDKHIEFPD